MIAPAYICVVGITVGFLLIRRVPTCPPARLQNALHLSIVIPARNEEANIPKLLKSIAESTEYPPEVFVIDDASSDSTALVARNLGATVVASAPLPEGWTGKAWACHQGALRASGDTLLFLDADTYFIAGGLDRIVARWLREGSSALALSVLPYYAAHAAYEQLSLVFNLLMAAGAGGFGALTAPQLFGQSLLIGKETYFAVGGHAIVRGALLENLSLARHLRSSGTRILCLGGRGTLHMRMFPEGFRQMSDSWTKALTQGAAASGAFVLVSAVLWISALWSAALLVVAPHGYSPQIIALAYLLLVLQLTWFARQLGSYNIFTCLLYPLPLAYYCVIFCRSAIRRMLGYKTAWRGRDV